MKRIKRFSVIQNAKFIAIMYTALIAVFTIPIGGISVLLGFGTGNKGFFAGALFIFIPLFYGVIFFISSAIGFAIYNFFADKFGGIELEIE